MDTEIITQFLIDGRFIGVDCRLAVNLFQQDRNNICDVGSFDMKKTSDKETEKTRDDALRRALSMPPKPKKTKKKRKRK